MVMKTATHIDTEKLSKSLRDRGVKTLEKKVLVTNFAGSQQEKDLSQPPNCQGFGRIHHFRRQQPDPWPENPLPIDPATKFLGISSRNELEVQVFQTAFCSWRCWYCFVDFALLSADKRFSEFKSADELLDLFFQETVRPQVIDLSGGQPDLVPEWGFWFWEALRSRGLEDKFYLWTDDNLSNDYLWRFLNADQIKKLSMAPNYGRVGCFKGFDEHSFAFNTKADPHLFEGQFRLMKRLVDAGFDVYGYATFTSQSDQGLLQNMHSFVDRLQELIHPIFPLRTVPLRITTFTPTAARTGADESRSLLVQEEAIKAWKEVLQSRFSEEQMNSTITKHSLGNR